MPAAPHAVSWTDHALAKAQTLGVTRTDVETALVQHHAKRRGNTGAADWILKIGGLVIAYDYPAEDDPLFARVVTVWRSR